MKQIQDILTLLFLKVSRKSTIEMGWVVFGQTINLLLTFIIIKFISKIGPEQYGIYALILTIAALLGLFYGSFLQGFLRYYYHYENLNQRDNFILLMYKFLKLSILIFILITIITSILYPFINKSYNYIFLLIAGLFIIFSKLSEFFNSILNLIRKRKANSLLQVLEKLIMIFVLTLLLNKNKLGLVNILITLGSVSLIIGLIKFISFRRFVPINISNISQSELQKEMTQTVLIYISPFLIWGVAGWLQLNGERWVINAILSLEDVGVYAIMMSIVNALVVVPNNIITEFATPIIFKQFANIENKADINIGYTYIRINTILILLITIIATLISFLWGHEIIRLISSENYATYWSILPLLVLGIGLFYIGQAQTLLGMGLSKPQKYIAPKLIIGIGSIGLNLFFISTFGFMGISCSILLIGLMYVIYISIVNQRILKTS